jgi:Chaperone of endosialidase
MNQLLNLKSFRMLLVIAAVLLHGHSTAFAGPNNNTSLGVGALPGYAGGEFNTALGFQAIHGDLVGHDNTATGAGALFANSGGNFNVATGRLALVSNFTGSFNTAIGNKALFTNTNGFFNTASGDMALFSNTIGASNTASGDSALKANTTGVGNMASGYQALLNNTTGNNNVAIGSNSGPNVTTSSGVTCLGAGVGGANVSNTTWIGNVFGVTTQNGTTAPVVVSADGQLGTVASSERFKKDVANMDKVSEAILSLRPVTFHYKTDTKSTPQFGLVAEEVAKVNPDLVMRDKNGEIYTVRYEAVHAMLLNEFLKEHDAFVQEQRKVQLLEKQVEKLTAGLQKVSDQLEESKAVPQAVVINQ